MKSTDFTIISTRYERDSLIQKSAAEKLISLLDIRRDDDVLDLGCGTGNLTRKLRGLTDGNVAGVDPSEGMIRQAKAQHKGRAVHYAVQAAESLDYRDMFTVIFCNSAFQWFRQPIGALKNCCDSLRKDGRMAIQAPAKKSYCPNFLTAIDRVARDPRTAKTFSGFKPPWLFLDTTKEYEGLFKEAGFTVPFSVLEEVRSAHKPEEVMTIFESGAAAGYLNQEYYRTRINESYAAAFRDIVGTAFRSQANSEGMVELTFHRIYLLAMK